MVVFRQPLAAAISLHFARLVGRLIMISLLHESCDWLSLVAVCGFCCLCCQASCMTICFRAFLDLSSFGDWKLADRFHLGVTIWVSILAMSSGYLAVHGPVLNCTSFRVFQVVEAGVASRRSGKEVFPGSLVLFIETCREGWIC